MPEPISEIEVYRYELSEVESHLSNIREELNRNEINKQTLLIEIEELEKQITEYKEQISKLEQ